MRDLFWCISGGILRSWGGRLQLWGLTRSREGKRRSWFSVFGVRSGEPRTGVRGWGSDRGALRCRAGRWQCVGECLPPHPRPLSPVSRGRGEIVGEPRTVVRGWLFRSSGFPARDLPCVTGCLQVAAAGRGAAGGLTRSREGGRTLGRGDWCNVLPGSAFHFLQSAFYGMDAMSPSPPISFPRFTGAKGGDALVRARARARARAGAGARAGGGGCWFARGTFVASLLVRSCSCSMNWCSCSSSKGASLFFSSAKPACWKGGRGRGRVCDQGARKWSSVVGGRRSPAEDSKKRRRRVSGGDCCEDCSSRSARLAWQRRQPMVERWKSM